MADLIDVSAAGSPAWRATFEQAIATGNRRALATGVRQVVRSCRCGSLSCGMWKVWEVA